MDGSSSCVAVCGFHAKFSVAQLVCSADAVMEAGVQEAMNDWYPLQAKGRPTSMSWNSFLSID